MIVSFANKETELLANRTRLKKYKKVEKIALRKLWQLDIAKSLSDLKTPPGNRLESLKGKRLGQHSIRINNQYRLCFIWTEKGPKQVEITDYH